MIIIQLDSEQLASLIKSSIRNALDEQASLNKNEVGQFLAIKEAATFLNLAPQTIYGFTSQRAIPFLKRGKKLYFKKTDLEKWLTEGRKETKDEIESSCIKKEKGGKHG